MQTDGQTKGHNGPTMGLWGRIKVLGPGILRNHPSKLASDCLLFDRNMPTEESHDRPVNRFHLHECKYAKVDKTSENILSSGGKCRQRVMLFNISEC